MKAGLLGCGNWGRNHGRVLARHGVLAAVADISQPLAAETADKFGVTAMSPGDMLADPSISAIVIAVDPRLHSALAIQALQAGKHILVEKPIALSAHDAARVRDAAERAGRIAMTGHILRYNPAFEQLLELVSAGTLGRLQFASATRKGFGKFFPGVSAIWDLAPHDLSMILPLIGRAPRAAWGRASCIHTDDHDAAELRFDFGDDFGAVIHLSRVSRVKERRLEVKGTLGTAVFDELAPSHERLMLSNGGEPPMPVAFHETEPLDAELRHFIDCIAAGRAPLTGAAHGHDVLKIIEGMALDNVPASLLPKTLQTTSPVQGKQAAAS
ncbi:MAG: Gfo/Idh/MocA family oxidoreductase [Pseudomonadota bacterium]